MARYNPYGLSEHLKPGVCYIYALCEPGTLEVRYVGKAEVSVLDRWQGHMGAARRGVENPVSRWIAEWQKVGKEPTPIMLTECPNKIRREVERAWVQLFVDNGYQLLNVQLNSTKHPHPERGIRRHP